MVARRSGEDSIFEPGWTAEAENTWAAQDEDSGRWEPSVTCLPSCSCLGALNQGLYTRAKTNLSSWSHGWRIFCPSDKNNCHTTLLAAGTWILNGMTQTLKIRLSQRRGSDPRGLPATSPWAVLLPFCEQILQLSGIFPKHFFSPQTIQSQSVPVVYDWGVLIQTLKTGGW